LPLPPLPHAWAKLLLAEMARKSKSNVRLSACVSFG
jgi:hypothetical protein